MDVASAGRQGRGTEHRCPGQRQHDRTDAQKNILKPHLKEQWVIPPDANAAFVAGMEDVLEVYHRPHDPDRPVVCLDETSKQLIAETRVPIPAKPGHPKRYDYECPAQRDGQPVHDVRAAGRLAPCPGDRSPHRRRLCADSQRPVGQALPQRLADHAPFRTISTPPHRRHSPRHSPPPRRAGSSSGSSGTTRPSTEVGWTWLRSELGVVSSQCLDRRIPDKQTLIEEVAAWEDDRNKNHAKADWQFTTADARVKLKRLYPTL